jgi:predicted nucleic acid-binding protein
MTHALVDTVVLVDYKDTDAGDRHERAKEIVRGIDSGDLPRSRVTDYVMVETLNLINERQRHDIAADLFTRLNESAGYELVQAADKDFRRALELFQTYEPLSLGDATIAAYMERTGIEHLYSYDDNFDGIEWITRFDTATDPRA